MKSRLDQLLVDLGLAPSRSQARLLIKEGYVSVDGVKASKPSQAVTSEQLIQIDKEVQYVGRGAHKLEGALASFNITPQNLVVADVGASTGGFTDYLLRNGAAKVYAIDVGHDQLAPALRQNPQVVNLEGHNIRDELSLPQKMDLAVVDLSYISLRLVLKPILKLLKEDGEVVALVKPQFEAGKQNVGKKGVIRDADLRQSVLEDLYDWCLDHSFNVQSAIRSPIEGKTGNVEYFFHLTDGATFERQKLKDL